MQAVLIKTVKSFIKKHLGNNFLVDNIHKLYTLIKEKKNLSEFQDTAKKVLGASMGKLVVAMHNSGLNKVSITIEIPEGTHELLNEARDSERFVTAALRDGVSAEEIMARGLIISSMMKGANEKSPLIHICADDNEVSMDKILELMKNRRYELSE